MSELYNMDMESILNCYNNQLQQLNTIFKYTSQEDCVQAISYSDGVVKIDTNCFNINGYEFARKFIKNKAYHHLFKSLTLMVDIEFSSVYIDDREIYSGLDALNAIQEDLSVYNQIEDFAHYFYTNHLNQTTVQDFLNTLNDFNRQYADAIYDLEEFLNQHKEELTTINTLNQNTNIENINNL